MSSYPLVSIIVPVYNVEKYLNRCVRSLIGQTYPNLEIILVDDGSPDRSPKMCDEYAKKYPNIKVIHKENGGLSSARNAGLQVVSGEFIGFIDSDDWIEADTYQYMIDLMQRYDADVVDIECFFCTGEEERASVREEHVKIYEKEDIIWRYLYRGISVQGSAPYSVWRKLYKKEVLNDTWFELGKTSEDMYFNYLVLKKAKRVVESNQIKYHYFQNSSGISLGKLKKSDLALIEFSQRIYDQEKNNKYKEIDRLARAKLARSYFSLLTRVALKGCSDDIANQKKLIGNFQKNLRSNYFFLMKSPIAVSRKLAITLECIDYRLIKLLALFLKV